MNNIHFIPRQLGLHGTQKGYHYLIEAWLNRLANLSLFPIARCQTEGAVKPRCQVVSLPFIASNPFNKQFLKKYF